jgi:four helix bundle protein
MSFKFEKLPVWHRAVILTDAVNGIAKNFPKEEEAVLSPQIRRAANAISIYIAHGSTDKDSFEFIDCLDHALRSTAEVVACIFLARRRKYIEEKDFNKIYNMCETILGMLNTLRLSVNKRLLLE